MSKRSRAGVSFRVSWTAGSERRRLLFPGEVACVGFAEHTEFDQAFQLGAGAFDVLRQQFVAEGFADVLGP